MTFFTNTRLPFICRFENNHRSTDIGPPLDLQLIKNVSNDLSYNVIILYNKNPFFRKPKEVACLYKTMR